MSPDDASTRDAQLVLRCLEGDTDAYGDLVDVYQGAVYATAYYYAGRYGAAEDIAQDAFFAAYRALPRLKDPARFAPWLREVTCRTSANWLRKHGERIQNETPLPHKRTVSIEDARATPRGALERQERYELVQKAIESLPERYRLPVVLRYVQELSYEEIGAFTGESRDEIRGVLQRAGRQLRHVLAGLVKKRKESGAKQWRHAHE
ncbi:MAG: sigma-70 family RNA polymerase sigma factor [bacterium]|nr:sigma-70 family RNA polymerase sigma factor [bacterium]